MLASLVIVFREAIEAGLIVGIVLAATRGVPHRGRWVGYGVAAGTLGACLVAGFASELGALFNGSGQELFNAAVLLIAVGMLTWHNAWMAGHGRELAREQTRVPMPLIQSAIQSQLTLAIFRLLRSEDPEDIGDLNRLLITKKVKVD